MPPKKGAAKKEAAKEGEPLRFAVGARVECNCGEWKTGTVVKLWYKEPGWPPEKVVPYQVKIDNGPTIFAPADNDICIRGVSGILAVGKIPVTVMTGFLGAGKTTLLNYILTVQHGKKYAVIENEFGEVSIDNQLIDAAVGKKDTVESITVLDNGCLCCTVRDDLVEAIKEIVKKVEDRCAKGFPIIDGILIETTGMADPGPIIKTFGMDEVVQKYCKIDGILTVVDCKHFLTQLTREREADSVNEPAQQVGFADKLLLNKVDVCNKELIDQTKAAIRKINSFVPIKECSLKEKPDEVPIGELLEIEAFDAAKMITDQSGKAEVNLVLKDGHQDGGHGGYGGHEGGGHGGGHDEANCDDPSHGGHGGDHGEGHGGGDSKGGGHAHAHKPDSRHDTDVKSMVLEVAGAALDMHKFRHWLGTVIEERSVDLYRYKGVLAVQQKEHTLLYILQGVHDMPELTFSGQWPEGKPIKTQVVLIGRKLDVERYRKEFAECKME